MAFGESSGSDQTPSQSQAAHHESLGKDPPPGNLGWGKGRRRREGEKEGGGERRMEGEGLLADTGSGPLPRLYITCTVIFVPRPLSDFISQLWSKIRAWPGNKATDSSTLTSM